MYNQCFSCQHNDKTRTISLNCIIIKLNVAAVCILSPKFWQSDSWIRRRCNLRSKHKFLVWKRVLEVTACWNKIFSYLFYNQTDKNGACICKKWVKLSKFIYEVLKLALCANLNKWYWSHFVIFSFQPIFSPPWPEDSPEESESIVGKEKQKVKVSSDEANEKRSPSAAGGYLYPAGAPPRGDRDDPGPLASASMNCQASSRTPVLVWFKYTN